ncbi:MAG: extracellular solute-binding protein [Eubacterium ramulus]|uniref:extracellular solute-binding protein n=1 Tax=Eubacterium ramulus TaxID=39490 RepID=UPI0039A16907
MWGLNEPALSGWNVLPYIWSNGGNITDEDCTTATGYINSPETVAAVNAFVDMYANGEFTGFNSGDIPMTDGFGTGRYMMLLEGPWKTAELAGAYPDFNYGMSEIPAGSAGAISVLGGEDIAMFNTGNKEGAWKFMKFMTNEFAQEEMAKCGQIPVNTTALESETVKNAEYAPFLEAIKTAKARPPVASWSEIDNALAVAMTDMIVNGANVQSTLDELAVTIDVLLAE